MSPEQALAKRIVVDHRTDIYSLGVTLYELLTLQPVFTGQDRHELLRQIAFEEPKAPRRLNKAIPEELEIIVLKAMAKNPAERYDTAQDLADDLRRFLEDRPIRARRPTLVQRAAKWSRRHKPIVWSAAISTFLLLVAGLVGLGIGNILITKERDAKDQALVAKDEALDDKTAALKDKNDALVLAEANLQKAEAQRQRAESNLTLALDALDTVYLRAIGRDRLLGDRDREEARRQLSNTEKTLIEAGLDFYSQIASQNEESTAATFETARAHLQIAMLQANLDDSETAETAFSEAIARLKKLTESFPNEAEYFRELGKAYYAYGNHSRWWPEAKDTFADAERALTRALELNPKHADTYCQRGEVYPRFSQYDRALADFEKAAELDPNNPWRHIKLATFLYVDAQDEQVRDYDRALHHAKEAVRLAPDSAICQATLGRAHWCANRDHERALTHLTKAIELDPSYAWAHVIRCIVYLHTGKHEEAVQSADRAIELGLKVFANRAEAYQAAKQFDKALADYKLAEDIYPNDMYIYAHRSDIYLARKQYEAALAELNKAVELQPRRSILYKRRALVHFHLRHFEEAISDLRNALELNAKDTSAFLWIPPPLVAACPDQSFRNGLLELAAKAVENSPDLAGALQTRAALYLGLSEWEKGQADLEKALESEAANHYAHYQNALLCLILNEAPKYRDACAAMVGKLGETDDPMAANFVAWTCALAPDAVDDYAPVLACATKAVEAQPHTDQFLNTLGAILYRAGRQEEAIEWLTELDRHSGGGDAKASSSPGYTWYFLAMVHKKTGNDEQAREYLDKANAWTDEALADEENPPVWNRRATLELLRKEGEALVAAPDDAPEPSDQKSPEPSGDARLSLTGSYQWVLHCRRAGRLVAEENWSEAVGAFSEAIESRPDDWELWKGRGEAREKLDQWDQAIADYQRAIEVEPEEWSFWRDRAESFAQSEQWDRAMALYTSLIEHNSDNASLWKGRGEAHEKLDQWDQAIADYQKAIELEPKEWPSWKARADNLAPSGQRDKAIALYTSLLKHHSDNGELWQARGTAHFHLRQWDQAIDDCTQAIKLRPDDVVSYVRRSASHRGKGDFAEAIDDCTSALGIDPKSTFALVSRAIAYRVSGNLNEALEDTNTGLMAAPDHVGLLHERAVIYETMKQWDKALADYNKAIGLAPRDHSLYQDRARTHQQLRQWDKAQADYGEAIRLTPEDPGLHAARGEAYLGLGRYDEALADWNRYVELGRDDAVAALIRAQILLLADRSEEYRQACKETLDRFGQAEDAGVFCHAARSCVLSPKAVPDPTVPVDLAARAVSSNPREWTLYTLGMAHLRAGDLDEAERRLHESLKTAPTWKARFLNWLGLALVHHARGETEESRNWLDKAVDLMEQHPAGAMQDRIESQLLRREVERLLGQSEQEGKSAASEKEE
jgi:tetratricopeptide (TPR) repeat protein